MAHFHPKDAEGFINLFALPVTQTAGVAGQTSVSTSSAEPAAAKKP
jgi:hypothetical protein